MRPTGEPATRMPSNGSQELPDAGPDAGGRIAALDGLRAIAVLAVMLYHTGSVPLEGGFLGVDVFFVLSGFLISGILISQWRLHGRIDAADFWLRRARRLAPALLLVLGAVAVARLVIVQPAAQTWRAPILAALTYTTNWYEIWSDHDYFGQFASPSPLVHTWSLAIEEQFYIGFAILLIVILPRLRDRSVAVLLGVLAGASAVLMAWSAAFNPTWAYYSTLSRVQALLIGGVIGALVEARRFPKPGGWLRLCGWLGLAGLLALFVAPLRLETMLRGGFSLAALCAALLISGLLGTGLLTKLLSARPLVLLGLISYGVYLWHWPVFLWLQSRQSDASPVRQIAAFVITVALATVSYVVLERPVRQGRFTHAPVARQWGAYAVGAAAVVSLAMMPARTAGGPAVDRAQWPADSAVPQRIAVAGDSTMLRLVSGFPGDVYPGRVVDGPTTVACGLVDVPFWRPGLLVQTARCRGWQSVWRERLAQLGPEVVVVGSLVWDLYDRASEHGPRGPGSPEFDQPFLTAFREAVGLAGKDGAVPVYVLGIPCMSAELDAEILDDPVRAQRTNHLIREAVATVPNAHFVDLAPLTCRPDGSAIIYRDGRLLRDDGVHWTRAGAEEVWSLVLQQMVADGVATRVTPSMTP